jgi:hypothetical protein
LIENKLALHHEVGTGNVDGRGYGLSALGDDTQAVVRYGAEAVGSPLD